MREKPMSNLNKGVVRLLQTISLFGWLLSLLLLCLGAYDFLVDYVNYGSSILWKNTDEYVEAVLIFTTFSTLPQLLVWIIDGFNGSEKSSILFLGKWLDKK